MRPRRAGWLVGLILVGASAAGARADEPLAPGTLSGRLVDPEGRPVAGARVSTANLDLRLQGRNGRAVAESDAEGRFRLGPLEPCFRSDYVLTAEAEGLVGLTTPRGEYTVYPGADHDLGAIRLDPGRVFTGTVLDADGTPRAGVAVAVSVARLVRGHSGGDAYPKATVQTDEEGWFRTAPLPVGRLGLAVEAPGRQLTTRTTAIRPGGAEDLGPITLAAGVDLAGVVRDEEGRPVAGARVLARGGWQLADDRGGFTVRSLAPDASFQMTATRPGYATVVGIVRLTAAGVVASFERGGKPGPAAPGLEVVLPRVGTIEGAVVDADTDAPVQLTRVVLSNFARQRGGEILHLGSETPFPQNRPGRYGADFRGPGEYRLVLSAEGYHDAEAFSPVILALGRVEGPAVRMRRREAGTPPTIPRQSIGGTVARAGVPVRSGWIAAWAAGPPPSAPNVAVLRGRTVVDPPVIAATVPIRDGAYALDVPFPNDRLFLVVDEPGQPLAQAGPIALGANEARRLDIAPPAAGTIRGRVAGVPAEWRGQGHVVAFNGAGLAVDARVAADGTFALPPLPPGEYGLKVGHDAYEDAETYPGPLMRLHPESFSMPADPWRRAVRVTVEAGREVGGVVVAWPE